MSSYISYKPEWVREDFIDFIAAKVSPIWAWKRIKASVVQTQQLSAGFVKIQIRPNHHFKHVQVQAGQSILVTVVIAGIRQQRSYSIVDCLENGDLTIAVKAQGVVSHVLNSLQSGDVIEISQSQGDFVFIPQQQPILLIASGSGITAIYALLKKALNQHLPQIDLIYFSRDEAFHVELMDLATRYAQFNYTHINTLEQQQYLDQTVLEKYCPNYKATMTYACGVNAMMQSLNQLYQQQGITEQLKQEYFQLPVDENLDAHPVTFSRSQVEFFAEKNLLLSAEQAGLKPTHGCRMGICNSCTCTKLSGSTKNMLTGEVDHSSNTQIKLCISQAMSPVMIQL